MLNSTKLITVAAAQSIILIIHVINVVMICTAQIKNNVFDTTNTLLYNLKGVKDTKGIFKLMSRKQTCNAIAKNENDKKNKQRYIKHNIKD